MAERSSCWTVNRMVAGSGSPGPLSLAGSGTSLYFHGASQGTFYGSQLAKNEKVHSLHVPGVKWLGYVEAVRYVEAVGLKSSNYTLKITIFPKL